MQQDARKRAYSNMIELQLSHSKEKVSWQSWLEAVCYISVMQIEFELSGGFE
jgi:hypothetical protein